jgi:hypothetical protein
MPSDLHSLAARAEAADPSEQREVLIAAAAAVVGAFEKTAKTTRLNPFWTRFQRMLDAEAYESAAMMLLPVGCRFNLNKRPYAEGRQDGYHTQVWFSRYYETAADIPNAWASTPALALIAAACRARATQGENDG